VTLEDLGSLWRRERAASRARFAEEQARTTLAERAARGIAIRDLSLDDVGPAPGGRARVFLVPRRPGDLEGLKLGPGDPVRLRRDATEITATLARVAGGRVALVVDDAEPFEQGRWQLDREQPEATFDRGDRAIARFVSDPALARLRDVLLGVAAPAFAAAPAREPFDAELNPPQLEAVARAAAARDLALVHGPPGTGKTRTLVEVIRQAMARGERVLATAASNTAVDNLAERLVDHGVVRLGHPARVAPAVEHRSLDALLDASDAARLARRWRAEAQALARRRDPAARALHADARRHLEAEQARILARAPVVCATAAGADDSLLGDTRFDLVVLDEATQAPDPIALAALARGRRAVLAGDPCQLPPTVIDLGAARAGLGTTFFERLAPTVPPSLLVVQHRMHRAIMDFPSRAMYGGRLVAAPAVAAHRLEDLGVAADPLRPGPLVVIDTAGTGWSEENDDPSTRNPGQAERTAAEVRRLLGRGVAPGDLAVITPYDAQARLLRELLPGVEIGTVDGFQGREKEAIVVDLVRSNPDGALGFLADRRRLNVALTRARRQLVVVGDSATLAGDPFYAALFASADAAGALRSAWADDCPPW
jgi:hypothetical protein